jgi:hypothetical protein
MQVQKQETTSSLPLLLHFLEPVTPMQAPEHSYDPATQTALPLMCMGGTERTRSYSNRTSGYGLVTGYEDADDEYVTVRD